MCHHTQTKPKTRCRHEETNVSNIVAVPMTGADQELWAAERVSDSSESGLSGCLSCCSVLLVDLALRPVPQGGVELSLIVCSSSIREATSRIALTRVGYTIW